MKVLVIDDIAHIRRLVARMLQQAGYETLEANNGLEGLKMLQTHQPDVVTCDVSMPIMDGHEFLAKAKNNPETQNIPIIMVTAIGEAEKTFTQTTVQANAYITKPFSSNKLIDTIRSQFVE